MKFNLKNSEKKICFIFFALFLTININAQELKVSLSKNEYNYVISDTIKNINLQVSIKNVSSDNIVLALSTSEIDNYLRENEYFFELYGERSGIAEHIFSPRIVFYEDGAKEPLLLEILVASSCFIDIAESNKEKFAQEKKHRDNVRKFGDKNFPNKPFHFVDRAMYINNNLMILQPNEERKFELNFDPMIYDTKRVNYEKLFQKNNKYEFYVKIHNDKKTILKHLTKDNLEKIKSTKSKFIKGDIYSEKAFLNMH